MASGLLFTPISLSEKKPRKMSTKVETKPRDCTACRLVGSAGLIGIGGYLANIAWKNQTFAGRYTISTLSFAFIVLGISRYKQTYPFDKTEENAISAKVKK